MRRYLSENAVCISLMGIGVAVMAWLGLYGFAWNDYDNEARPSVEALVHGHLLEFLRLAPAYGGSLVLRAPFALLPGLWGGGELAVYRAVAMPCLIAGGALGVYLVAQMRSQTAPRLWRIVVMGVCVANPITLHALEVGHPEDVLGAALCVASVLLAEHDRPLLAGLTLGAAIANKEWALLAVGPVMFALPSRRILCLLTCGALAATVLAPLSLVGSGGFIANARGAAAPPSTIFQPWQVWWFLGHHGEVVKGLFGGIKPGYRVAPSWIGSVSHPLIIVLGLPFTAILWRRERRPGQALALLTLLMLLRCMLDSWDTTYYTLPFVFALLAWEVLSFERPPVLAFLASVSVWVIFQWLPLHVSADAQSVFFLAFSLPALGAITAWLYKPNIYADLVVHAKVRFQSRSLTVAGVQRSSR
jgi:hypothetical protein